MSIFIEHRIFLRMIAAPAGGDVLKKQEFQGKECII
jgi:hypothetical protein